MDNISDEVKKIRKPNFPILPLFVNRLSPRSMTGESMTDEELFPLFEAARWAPSNFNSQPWRFFCAEKGDPRVETFLQPSCRIQSTMVQKRIRYYLSLFPGILLKKMTKFLSLTVMIPELLGCRSLWKDFHEVMLCMA